MSDHAHSAVTSKMQTLLLNEAEIGTTTKVPRLLTMDDYPHWKPRFEIHINGLDTKMWDMINIGYPVPMDENRVVVPLVSMNAAQRGIYDTEKKAYSHLSQAIPREVFHQFRRYKTSKDLWDALEKRNEGNASLKAMKVKALRKEFDNFNSLKTETLYSLINRYFHLLSEMHVHGITTSAEEEIQCLADALPDSWTSYMMVLKNSDRLIGMDINDFVTLLREQEQENKNRLTRSNQIQDPSLYYCDTQPPAPEHAPLKTAFVTNSSGSSSQTVFGLSAGSSSVQQPSSGSTTLKTENFSKGSVEVVKDHIAMLTTLVSSYDELLAGKIGNCHLTHEDYDQLDRDEMERLDIMWGMANLVRRAKDYVKRTGKELQGNKDSKYGFDMSTVTCYNCGDKGHFARQCEKPKKAGAHNPFNGSPSNQNSSDKSKALVTVGSNAPLTVIQEEEGNDWSFRFGNDANVGIVSGINEGHDWSLRFENDADANVVITAAINEESASESESESGSENGDGAQEQQSETKSSESEHEAKEETSDSKTSFAFKAETSTADQVCSETSSVCIKCLKLSDVIAKLKSGSERLSYDLSQNLVIKGNERILKEKNESLTKQVCELECALLNKQRAINVYINEIDALKRAKASLQVDYETLDQKLRSYSCTSYLLEHMIKGRSENDQGGKSYKACPPPVLNQLVNTPHEPEQILEATPPCVTERNVNLSTTNDKGKGVATDVTEGTVEDCDTDSDCDTPGFGTTQVEIQKSIWMSQASTSKPKSETKQDRNFKSKSKSQRKSKSKPDYSPLTKPVILVREGGEKYENVPVAPLKTENVKTGYVPPHRRTGSQVSSFEKRVTHRPTKFVDCRTCFNCGECGHVVRKCPKVCRTPQRKVDPRKTFSASSSGSSWRNNVFVKNRSTSPVKNRALFQTPAQSKTSSLKNDEQSNRYLKCSSDKSQVWKSKSAASGNSIGGSSDAPSGSNGKWVDLQVIGADGKPTAIRAWVSIPH